MKINDKTPDGMQQKKQHLLLIIVSASIVILFASILYKASASYGFVYDDYYTVITNNDIKDISSTGLKHIFSEADYTNFYPLRTLAYGIIYNFEALNSTNFHIANILFNTLNCALVFILCFMMLAHSFSPANINHNSFATNIIAALFAALIFAAHPLHVEPTAWVSGFKELLSAFFCLLSLLFFIHLRTGGQEKPPSKAYHLSLLFFIAATLTRPVTVFLPVFMIIFDLLNPVAARRSSFSQRFAEFLFLFTVMAITIILNYALAIKNELTPENSAIISTTGLAHSSKFFLFYVSKLFNPLHLNVIYENNFISQYNSSAVLSVIILFISACILSARKAPCISAGLIFFAVSISPSINIIPVHIAPSETLAYLPSVGVCIALAGIIRWFLSTRAPLLKNAALFACFILVIALSSITIKRIPAWTDNLSLWKNTLETNPDSAVALSGYAEGLVENDDFVNAEIYYNKAITSSPDYFKPYVGLTKMYLENNNLQKSYSKIKEGYKHDIYNIELQYYYGIALYNVGEFISAIKILLYIEGSHPNYMETRQYLRTTLNVAKKNMRKKDFDKFVDDMKIPESIYK